MKGKYVIAAAMLAAAVLCAPVSAHSAESACVMDARTGAVLYEHNASHRSLIASTTKIMTGLLICEDCDLRREIAVPAEAVGVEGSSLYLAPGERMRIGDLLYGMMLHSGNDCAQALAIAHSGSVKAFVHAMNVRAGALGLRQTHFANPHGLDDAQNYSTAADLARLACAAMENEDFARTVGTKSCRIGDRTLVNHNQLLWRCPGAEGIKTGYTRAAGRILVSSATRCGRRLVCVSIRDPDDWNDHIRLLDEGFSRFAEVCVCPRGRVLGLLPGGVPAVCPEDVRTLLLPGERVDCVRICVSGEEATAQFMCGGTAAAACPLTAPPMGGSHGRTDPEDHCGPGGDLPPQG